MKRKTFVGVAILAAAFISTASLQAVPVTPDFDSFGVLAGETFGGVGIPNTAVAISSFGGMTFGLTAHQRLTGPNLVNDGAGTFTAPAGESPFSPAGSAMWNIGWSMTGVTGQGYYMKLFYDFDPAAGNDQSTYGSTFSPLVSNDHQSQNLGFAFWDASLPPFINPPSGSFDENAIGEYGFIQEIYDARGTIVARNAILINTVGAKVPDGGSSAMLLGLGSLGIAAIRRKKQSV